MPNTNLYGQTFMKKREASAAGEGEYTYTSELNAIRQSQQTREITEYFGYFHLSNVHNESENREVWDRMHIKNSTVGRDVLHCKRSVAYNPWSVVERFPYS